MNDLNPWAPPVYNGINDTSPEGFVDEDFTYAIFVFVGISKTPLLTILQIDKDCDFVWRGIVAINLGFFPAGFRFTDGQSYFLSDQFIFSGQFQGDGASPFPVSPGEIIPAGTQLRIESQTPGPLGPFTEFELQLRGVKRRPKPTGERE